MKIATCSGRNNAFDMGECKFGEEDFFGKGNHLAARGDSSLILRGFPHNCLGKGGYFTPGYGDKTKLKELRHFP